MRGSQGHGEERAHHSAHVITYVQRCYMLTHDGYTYTPERLSDKKTRRPRAQLRGRSKLFTDGDPLRLTCVVLRFRQ